MMVRGTLFADEFEIQIRLSVPHNQPVREFALVLQLGAAYRGGV